MVRSTALARSLRRGVAFAVLGLVACGGGEESAPATEADAEAREPLAALREAPDFALETLEGDSLGSEDLADRDVVLMNFWASWCAPCRAEIPDLIELHEAYRDERFMVLGVTVNDIPRDSRAFVEEMEMPYPTVIGTPAFLEDYGISPWLPTTILVKDGEILREWVGPRSREEFEYPVRMALGKAPNGVDGEEEERTDAEGDPDGARPARRPDAAEPAAGPDANAPDSAAGGS